MHLWIPSVAWTSESIVWSWFKYTKFKALTGVYESQCLYRVFKHYNLQNSLVLTTFVIIHNGFNDQQWISQPHQRAPAMKWHSGVFWPVLVLKVFTFYECAMVVVISSLLTSSPELHHRITEADNILSLSYIDIFCRDLDPKRSDETMARQQTSW
jgi:hypothetical protein